VLKRCNTGPGLPRIKTTGSALNRSRTEASRSPQSRFGSHFGRHTGGYDAADSSSNSINEDEEELEFDDQEWGLHKGMELFEVSAKDDLGTCAGSSILILSFTYLPIGIENLFESLINAIIERKDIIERENELRKRDSVFLSTISTPTWAAQAEEEEAREKACSTSGAWNCCAS
jgi:hypothetical protein